MSRRNLVIAMILGGIILLRLVNAQSGEFGGVLNGLWALVQANALTVLAVLAVIVVLLVRGRLSTARQAPQAMRCQQCSRPMSIIADDKARKPHLTDAQRAEERANSVQYIVWQCSNGHTQVETPTPIKRASSCPQCGNKTLKTTVRQTVKSPSSSEAGQASQTVYCIYCGYRQEKTHTIPQKLTSQERARQYSSATPDDDRQRYAGYSSSSNDSSYYDNNDSHYNNDDNTRDNRYDNNDTYDNNDSYDGGDSGDSSDGSDSD